MATQPGTYGGSKGWQYSAHPGMSSPISPGKLISVGRDHLISNPHPSAQRFTSVVSPKDASGAPRTTGGTLAQVSLGTRSLAVLPKSYGGYARQKSPSRQVLTHGSGPMPKNQASVIQGETWASPVTVTQSLHSMPGGALQQAKALSHQIKALSVRIHHQKQQSAPIPVGSLIEQGRRPTWKADAQSLLRPASAPSRESAGHRDLRRQSSLTSVTRSDHGQGTRRSLSVSRSETGGAGSAPHTSMAAHRRARGSIRELYADWCAAVRMHAHASALSTTPAPMAQRAASGSSGGSAAPDGLASPAFKGPRPVLQAVPGDPDMKSVSASGADRLWLDQQKLTRCCIVECAEDLRMLSYQYNSIRQIEHVHACPELVFLDFYANSLTSLQGLQGLTHVRVLMLGRNNISSLTGLDTLAALDVLDVHHNRITDATPIAALTSLRILNLSSNCVATLPPLASLTSLAELNLRRNCLSTLHFGTSPHRSNVTDGCTPAEDAWLRASADACSSSGSPDVVPVRTVAGDGDVAMAAAADSRADETNGPRLPPCLQRLFASHNKVATIGDVPVLRALTQLRELALDANPVMNATHEIAARRQLLALCPTTLRALNGTQLTEDETRLISLKHRRDAGTMPAVPPPVPTALHAAPWRRRRSTAAVRPASAAAALSSTPASAGSPARGAGAGSSQRTAGDGKGKAGKGATGGTAGRPVVQQSSNPWVEWKDDKRVVVHGDALQSLKGDTRWPEARSVAIYRLDVSVALGAEALCVLARPPMLHCVTLCQSGIRTLAQLRPLTALSSLCELHILESPVTKLVLLRPFVAAMLPRVKLLNGEPQAEATQGAGARCIAPLLQKFWGASLDGAGGDGEFGEREGRAWGLRGVMGQGGGQGHVGGVAGACMEAERSGLTGCKVPEAQWGCRRLVEDWVDQAVAHAVDVERRWQILDECWDKVVREILEEWLCLLS
eukprot:jgi/Ulvmu1/7199/UM034_0108.1